MLPRYAFGITLEHACIDSVEPWPLAKVTNGGEVRGKGRGRPVASGSAWLYVVIVNQVPHGLGHKITLKSKATKSQIFH